jgi:hypothetical protein
VLAAKLEEERRAALAVSDSYEGTWQVKEWIGDSVGSLSFEAGTALVGQVVRLEKEKFDVPGFSCERPQYELSDTSLFWANFRKCRNGSPQLDCRTTRWDGNTMIKCSGSNSLPWLSPQLTVRCPDGPGPGFTFSNLTASRSIVHLWDGRGSLCLERVE